MSRIHCLWSLPRDWKPIVGIIVLFAVIGCAPSSPAPAASGSKPSAGGAAAPSQQAPAKTETSAEVLQWKLAGLVAHGFISLEGAKDFAKAVEANTAGRLKISVFAGGELFKASETLKEASRGTVPMAQSACSDEDKLIPICKVMNSPFLPLTGEELAEMANRDTRLYAILDEEFRKVDVKLLMIFPSGTIGIISRSKPLNTVASWNGAKISIAGDVLVRLFKAAGTETVSLDADEAVDALRRGVIEGRTNSASGTLARGVTGSIAKYFNPWSLYATTHWVVVNRDAWAKLPSDVRDIVDKTAIEWQSIITKRNAEIEAKSRKQLEEKGMTISDISKDEVLKAAALARPQHEETINAVGGNAQEFYDIITGKKPNKR